MNKLCKTENKKLNIITAYFLIYVVWGSTYYFIGLALKGFPPFLLGAFRFTIAGLLLLGWCYWRGESILKKSLVKKSAVSGIVLLFIDMAVVMIAQQYLNSSLVAIIASSTAIWIMVLDMPMWKKNIRNPLAIVGIIIGFLGVLMLYIEQHNTEGIHESQEYGIVILLFGCISWALGTLYAKYFSSGEENTNSFSGSAWHMIFASGIFWFCSIASGEITTVKLSQVSALSWFSLAYLIVLGSALAYSAYIWLLKVRPATEVGTHAYVNPFIAVFIGKTFGNEKITLIQLFGLLVIVFSIVLINWKTNYKPESKN
jgi:drug/metabolite transporter (DMT)-like permease